jgi:hypothetical protein
MHLLHDVMAYCGIATFSFQEFFPLWKFFLGFHFFLSSELKKMRFLKVISDQKKST